jgi:hypothetical protein
MADIDLVTADRVSLIKGEMGDAGLTPPGLAGEAITAGAPVYLAAATGKWLNSDANASAPANAVRAMALKTVVAGEPVTCAFGKSMLDGFDLSGMSFGDPVYLSNNVGRVGTAAGSTSVIVGYVVPGLATLATATTADKLLQLAL